MKTMYSFLLFVLLTAQATAQTFEVTTESFDLEQIDRHKDWRIYSGFRDNSGNFVIKLGKPSCNMSTSVGGSSVEYTYSGVAYDFEELSFSPQLKYLSKSTKSFPNTMSALDYQPIFGMRFYPIGSSIYLKRPLTMDYIGTRMIIPEVGLKGTKYVAYSVIGKANGGANGPMGTTNYNACSENLWMEKNSDMLVKENKGERWISVASIPFPGGGVMAFVTQGVLQENLDKTNYIVKIINGDFSEGASIHLMFDYKCLIHLMNIDRPDGTRDFAVITQASEHKYVNGTIVGKPTQGELLILDGTTLAIKNRQSFNLPYTSWFAENIVFDHDGNMIIYGSAGDNQDFCESPGTLGINQIVPNSYNSPKQQPNFQIMMTDALGNIKYIKGIDCKAAAAKAVIMGGTDMKAKNTVILNTYDFYKDIYFANGQMILGGQQFLELGKNGVDKGHLFLATFDLKTGDLVNYFIRPEENFGKYDVVFNKERTAIYWATYDLNTLNEMMNEQGAITAKKIKSMVAGRLYLAKIDLKTGTAGDFQLLGEEQWAVNYNDPVVVGDDASDEIVFHGRTLSKKAKDSELVLIKVKK